MKIPTPSKENNEVYKFFVLNAHGWFYAVGYVTPDILFLDKFYPW